MNSPLANRLLWPGLLVFAASYPQAPLFTDNQNTKFLHGAASAGWGFLANDWTAGTADPLPVFSLLVEAVYRWLPLASFHVFFALLIGIYAWSSLGIVRQVFPQGFTGRPLWIFLALFTFLHLTDLNEELIRGVAHQYLLDYYLQPCVFGVFMLLAIRLLLEQRGILAALSLAVAALLHPGAYVLPSLLILAVGFWLIRQRTHSLVRAALPTLVFAALFLPLAIQQSRALGPTSPDAWRQAMDILSTQRIPHHTQVAAWFNTVEAMRLLLLIGVCWMVRKQAVLFPLMSVLTGCVVLATLILGLFPDAAAGFATPWRITAVLMPLAMVLLLMRLSLALAARLERKAVSVRRVRGVALAVAVLAIGLGVSRTWNWLGEYNSERSMGVIAYAREHAAPDQIYLLPPRQKIFDRFRLETGTPTVVNWKTHPYRDIEVLEWHDRWLKVNQFYSAPTQQDAVAMARRLAREYGVTHIVAKTEVRLDDPTLQPVFEDGAYRIYRFVTPDVSPPRAGGGA